MLCVYDGATPFRAERSNAALEVGVSMLSHSPHVSVALSSVAHSRIHSRIYRRGPFLHPARLLLLAMFSLLLAACQDPNLARAVEDWATRQQAASDTQIREIATEDSRLLILGEDGNIYTTNPAGRAAIAYTTDASDARQYLQPTWSPDGSRIAWGMVDRTGDDVANRVFVTDLSGSNLRQFAVSTAPFYYYWNPNGNAIAYLSNATSNGSVELALGLLDLADDADRAGQTIARGQPLYFAWDPAGEQIVTHIGESRIDLRRADGEIEPIASTNAGFPAPQWTSDGESIIYATELDPAGDPTRNLVVENLANAERRSLTTYDERIAFDLSPAGTRLAYAVSPADAASSALGPLYVIDLETGSTRELTSAPVLAFFWSPDGEKLAYLAGEAVGSGADVQLRLRWYVWDGSRSTGYDIILPSRTFLQSYLAFFDQYARSMTIWSPDSTAFAYAGIDQRNRSGIWVQELDEETPSRVAPGIFVAWSPR